MGTSVVKAEVLSLCEQLELSVRPGASSFGISAIAPGQLLTAG